ncbi:MAG: PfkB family carbohydrate kinase [Aggregatilineales bacterium]
MSDRMIEIVCMGEVLIDFVALENGVTVGDASGFQKAPGGAPANVAVAVERLAHQAAFISQVGDDPFGHFLAEVLEAEGVDITGLRFTDKARTMLAFVSLAAAGERSFSFYRNPSADMLLTPDDVALEVIDAAKIFHFGSITMISEPSKSATLKAAQYAKDKGLIVSYDPNLRLNLWESEEAARAGMISGLDYATMVKLSDEELDFMVGGDLNKVWREGMKLIVITHGGEGSVAYTRDGGVFKHGGYSVSPVDTTGAGDGFVAGMLVGILENPDDYLSKLEKLLCFANAVGALTTTNRGAIPALPTRSQVDAFAKC